MKEADRSIEGWQKQWMQDEGWGCGRDRQAKTLGLTATAVRNLIDKIEPDDRPIVVKNTKK